MVIISYIWIFESILLFKLFWPASYGYCCWLGRRTTALGVTALSSQAASAESQSGAAGSLFAKSGSFARDATAASLH